MSEEVHLRQVGAPRRLFSVFNFQCRKVKESADAKTQWLRTVRSVVSSGVPKHHSLPVHKRIETSGEVAQTVF